MQHLITHRRNSKVGSIGGNGPSMKAGALHDDRRNPSGTPKAHPKVGFSMHTVISPLTGYKLPISGICECMTIKMTIFVSDNIF